MRVSGLSANTYFQAIKKTENDLNQRELGLMSQHADAVQMGKETLALKQDLAKKQIEAYMTDGKDHFIS